MAAMMTGRRLAFRWSVARVAGLDASPILRHRHKIGKLYPKIGGVITSFDHGYCKFPIRAV